MHGLRWRAGSSDRVAEAASELDACMPDRAEGSEAEERWKRMTYPAGRILHLVPACLRALDELLKSLHA